jgi:ribonucleoside-diphosphate reductase alpha chain
MQNDVFEHQGDIANIESIPDDLKEIYKTSFTTSPYAYIEVAARAQKWIDQAMSRNMYLETRDNQEVMKIYATAWEKGLKSTYYLHMKPRHTAEQSTSKVNNGSKLGKTGFGALKARIAAVAPTEEITPTVTAHDPVQSDVTPKPKTPVVAKRDDNDGPEDPAERLVCDSCQ